MLYWKLNCHAQIPLWGGIFFWGNEELEGNKVFEVREHLTIAKTATLGEMVSFASVCSHVFPACFMNCHEWTCGLGKAHAHSLPERLCASSSLAKVKLFNEDRRPGLLERLFKDGAPAKQNAKVSKQCNFWVWMSLRDVLSTWILSDSTISVLLGLCSEPRRWFYFQSQQAQQPSERVRRKLFGVSIELDKGSE